MKKILSLCVALLCAYQVTNAQTQKGNQNLAIYLQYQHVSTSNSSSTPFASNQTNKTEAFNIGPSYGYFVSDGLELGALASYIHNTTESTTSGPGTTTSKSTTNGFSANLFLRKYVLYENKFGFRAGPYVSYGYNKQSQDNSSIINAKTNNLGAGATFDLVYYPTTKLGIAANLLGLNYTHSKTNGDYTANTNAFDFSFVNSGLGLSVFWVLK